jgi:hypothetical protein
MTTKEAERAKLEEWGNPFGFEYCGGQLWIEDLAFLIRARQTPCVGERKPIKIRINPLRNCK